MQSESYQKLINNIRSVIERSGMKQNYIAEKSGMNKNQLSNILCFRKRITVIELLSLCDVLGVTPNDMYFGQNAA